MNPNTPHARVLPARPDRAAVFAAFFATWTAVHAATVTVSTTVDEVNGNTTSIANLIATPGGAGISLREAVIAANNTAGADTINLPAGTYTLTRTGNDADSSNGDLDVNDSVTISGADPSTTIIQGATDASYTGSIHDKVIGINQDGTHLALTVTISGVTIRYGDNSVPDGDATWAYTGGGVDVFLTGTNNFTTFSNCVITANQTTNSYGGGVNVDSGTSGLGGDPAANTTNRGTVRFIRCNISNNRARKTGGGMNLFADIHNVVIDNCVITNNTALGTAGNEAVGGGLHIRHTYGGSVTVSNGTLIAGNTGRAFGGGVCVASLHPGPAIFKDSTISDNTVLSNGTTSAAGGGLYNGARGTVLIHMNLAGNHADSAGSGTAENPEGGGICNDYGTISLSGSCVISNNTATDGGGFYSRTVGSTSSIASTTFVNNRAKNHGGGLYVTNGIVTLDAVTFEGNVADSDSSGAGNGGGIYRAGGTLTLSNAIHIGGTARGNRAYHGGGFANAVGGFTLGSGQITDNRARGDGGGLYVTGGSITSCVPIRGNVANCSNTTAGTGGGIFNAGGVIVIASNSAIGGLSAGQSNSAWHGGGFANQSGSLIYIGTSPGGGTLSGNSAASNGGAGYVSGGAVYLSGLTIQSNSAATNGGAFYVSSGTLTALYCRIVGNTSGGARGIAQAGGSVTATNNWWGTNAPASLVAGTVNYAPWLMFRHTAYPLAMRTGESSALTASIVTNSANSAVPTANLMALVGAPVSFGNAKLGALSGVQTSIQSSGTATATFTASSTGGIGSADAALDQTSLPVTFTIQQPPLFTWCPGVTSNNTPGLCSAIVTFSATATGYPQPAVSFNQSSGGVFPVGNTVITATATNGVLPDATCIFTVTVVDAEAPTITCPATVVASEDPMGSGSARVRFLTPGASDLCSGLGEPVSTPPSGSIFPIGTNTVTSTVADLAGNVATCTFSVVVNVATQPAFRVVGLQAQNGNLMLVWATPGGRTNVLQSTPGTASGGYSDDFVDVTDVASFVIAPLGDTVTNCLLEGASSNTPSRYFRIRSSD